MPALSLSLLGAFAASIDDQPLTPFRTKSVQALLIYLVCEADRAHQREALMDLLWPGMPLASAQNNLRQTIYRLRQAIPEVRSNQAEGAVPFILANRQTVRINPDAIYEIDVQSFADLIDRDPAQAVALYRGDFLADFYLPDSETFAEWTNGRRAHFQRQVLIALDEVTAVHLHDGRYDEAEKLARRQLTFDNLRESGHRQLMRVLAGNGRRRAALSHYESLRQLLQAELDIEPSPQTQALVEAIRAGELSGKVGEKKEARGERQEEVGEQPPPPIPPLKSVPLHNLPTQATPFIGREAELKILAEFLTDPNQRLITIVGPGGIGKTRLALAVAEQLLGVEQFPDGAVFVDLAPLAEPTQMISAVADALKFPLQSEETRTPRQQLLDYLRHKQMLLLFDNFEHVLGGVDLLVDILQSTPALQILATSRERLHIRSEQLYLLRGLEFPDWEMPDDAERYTAVQLFLQSARRNQPDFALRTGDDLTYLARICRIVAGMPLALELAASWVDMLPLTEIAAGLQQGLDFLETDMRDVPERHRSVRTAVDYSWQQLETTERDIFAKLSVFRGGFTRQAAQAVAGANLRQLGRLMNKSFLQYAPASDRYQIHELLRQYGAEKLKECREETAVRDQHSSFFCTALQKWQSGLQSYRLRQTADEVEADYRNVEAAWEYALGQGHWEWLLLAVNGLGVYFYVNGRWLEGIKLLRESSKRLKPNQEAVLTTAEAGRLLIWFSAWRVNLGINAAEGNFDDAKYTFQHMLQLAYDLLQLPLLSGLDCRAEEAYVHLQLGRILKYIDGHWQDGQDHLTHCLRLYRELEYQLGVADALYESHFYAAHEEQAQIQLQENLALLQKIGEPLRLTRVLVGMGMLARNAGSLKEAAKLFEQAYSTAQKVGYLVGMYDVCQHKLMLARQLGYSDLALSISEEMLALVEQMNSPNRKVATLCSIGGEQLYQGQFLLALNNLQEARRHEQEIGLSEFSTPWRYSVPLPQIDLHTGQYEKVQSWRKIFGDHWWIIIQQMWVSLVRKVYEETLSLAQQVVAKLKLDPQNELRGQVEVGSPLCLALFELGHKEEARQELIQHLNTCLKIQTFVQLMPLVPVIARVLADTDDMEQRERAVELWAMAQKLPFVGNSQLFADLLSQPMAEAAAELPSDVVAAAQARGRELEWWPTAALLLDELKAWGWGEGAGEQGRVASLMEEGEQGRFIQEELVATGGFGEVYRGRDTETGQVIVIKRLKPELLAQQPDVVGRFVREGELLCQLNHPNIVQMIATEKIRFSEEIEGEQCLVMEYVAGGSLRNLLDAQGQLPVVRVLDIALELADALSRAHHLGIIHRDLKPANVLLAEDGTPRLTDFGISRMMQREGTQLTEIGVMMGTIDYMSPEACRGEELDAQADIWSFGVLLYEMLTGELPFQGEHFTATVLAILNNPTPDLLSLCPEVPPALVRLIGQMLVKERERRMSLGDASPGRMRQVAAELDRIRENVVSNR